MTDREFEKGSLVRIIKGKGKGQTGEIFWWGPAKFGDGMRAGVAAKDGEKYWVDEDNLAFADDDPTPATPKVATGKHLAGTKIVLTGDFEAYDRKQAHNLLEELGADVTGSVSGKTMVVLAGAKAGAKKLSDAEKRGVPVLGEPELLSLLAGRTLDEILTAAPAEPKVPPAGPKEQNIPSYPPMPRPLSKWRDAEQVEYFPGTDVVSMRGTVEHGLRHGAWFRYWPDGKPKEECHWVEGEKHGPELHWATNGTQTCSGQHERGKPVGTWAWWHDNGAHHCTWTYGEQQRKQGEYKKDRPDGTPQERGTHLDDKRHGTWTWYDDGEWSRRERHYEFGRQHGPERAWYAGEVLALECSWHLDRKQGEERTFSETDKPRFEGEWFHGFPVGEHRHWDDAGVETTTRHVGGLPAEVAHDEKLRAKLLKQLAKAENAYEKRDAVSDPLEYGQAGPYLLHLWREGHVDLPADSDLYGLLDEAHWLMSGEELVAILRAVPGTGYAEFFEGWPKKLDELAMRVYARDPEPLDRAWKSLEGPIRQGAALVRARFGHDVGVALHDALPSLVDEHVHNYGIGQSLLWPNADGEPVEQRLFDGGGATALFETFVEFFGGREAWMAALRRCAFAEAAEDVSRVSFKTFRDVVSSATPQEMSRLLDGIALDHDTQDRIHEALGLWRDDPPATTVEIVLGMKRDGLRLWPSVCTAILRLAAAGEPIPDSLLDRLVLHEEPPSYSSAWRTDPLQELDEQQRANAFYRLQRVPIGPGSAVPRMKLIHRTLDALSVEQARGVIERQLAIPYHALSVAQFLFHVVDLDVEALAGEQLALVERVITEAKQDSHGRNDRYMYGLGDLGRVALPSIARELRAAKKKKDREGWATAMIVALARTTAAGHTFDERYDACVLLDAIADDWAYEHYEVFFERVLYGLPEDRAAAILQRALTGKQFARAFAFIGAAPTETVLRSAFTELLAREAKLRHEEVKAVGRGLASLPNRAEWVRWILKQGAGGGLSDAFCTALGRQALNILEAGLEDEGTPAPAEIDHVEKLRRLAEDRSGSETIYLLRPLAEIREGLNQIGGPAPGVSKERWPTFDDEPMTHLFTLDVASMPGLEARVPEGVRAVSVFCADPDDNEAYEYGSGYTAVVFTRPGDLDAPCTPTEVDDPIDPQSFEVVAVKVDPSIWGDDDDVLRGEIYRASARVLGDPIWLQDGDGGGEDFLMQFDEGFVPMNLGDCGVMYVFTDDAFWQCH